MRVSFWPLAVLVALVLAVPARAQVWGELAGRVTDAATGDGVPGATVLIEGNSFGTNTAADGTYAFRIPEGRWPVRVSFVGYRPFRDTVVVRRGETERVRRRAHGRRRNRRARERRRRRARE